MSADWGQSRTDAYVDERRMRLDELLEDERALGYVQDILHWPPLQARRGSVAGIEDCHLATIARFRLDARLLRPALRAAGYLSDDDVMVDFEPMFGAYLKRRDQAAERQRRRRARVEATFIVPPEDDEPPPRAPPPPAPPPQSTPPPGTDRSHRDRSVPDAPGAVVDSTEWPVNVVDFLRRPRGGATLADAWAAKFPALDGQGARRSVVDVVEKTWAAWKTNPKCRHWTPAVFEGRALDDLEHAHVNAKRDRDMDARAELTRINTAAAAARGGAVVSRTTEDERSAADYVAHTAYRNAVLRADPCATPMNREVWRTAGRPDGVVIDDAGAAPTPAEVAALFGRISARATAGPAPPLTLLEERLAPPVPRAAAPVRDLTLAARLVAQARST